MLQSSKGVSRECQETSRLCMLPLQPQARSLVSKGGANATRPAHSTSIVRAHAIARRTPEREPLHRTIVQQALRTFKL